MQAFKRNDLWTLLSIIKYLLVFLIFLRLFNVMNLKRLKVHKKILISFINITFLIFAKKSPSNNMPGLKCIEYVKSIISLLRVDLLTRL